ncbi:indolepyruvate ferredoxin oxidoreductase alpha subunit [Desulfohalotomaculum tongense]|uniref:indolepyruvate ferredoxin oxidoreductase subunit alpha n=1 Tax=Desulforadius tongensis TaxID=1216062 RepID=UPI0019583DDF|nr:indolepyruvate ferredoxin oxidoreductase subunit alpha [Desulforadius tongensis]MBM7854101.1 indolepyruvate ferredoxin oxidoreductase alpha subunit [Desulforadius tongensis]
MKKLLMGNEAIAYGAVEAGVRVATAYPGTPSSEVFAALAAMAKENGIYAEWSINEKAALEVAAGAAYAGARAMVTMKQVGLNVAADPLMTLAYIGVKGGLVLVVADDPGPHSSQNEQDTRKFAQLAKLPVLDPAAPQEAKDMTVAAFDISEELGLPVILRPTTRTCHVCQDVELGEQKNTPEPPGFAKDSRWVIFPSLAFKRHRWLNKQQEAARNILESLPFNSSEYAEGDVGVVACGVAYNYVKEALGILGVEVSVLKIGTPYPLPEKLALKFLQRHRQVLVVEEQEPVVEDQLINLTWSNGLPLKLSGKRGGYIPREGELDVDKVLSALAKFIGTELPRKQENEVLPPMPLRTPVLCAGCPHRASFYAFKQAAGNDAIFTGDIGCYTLGNMPPLNAMDTCLCMGASITIASGLYRVEPERKIAAFLGDSTFFHTGIAGLVNAVHNKANITVVILDNRSTAMTGHQPHPGLEWTATGEPTNGLDITKIVKACGVEMVRVVDPYDLETAKQAAGEALDFNGPAVVIMRRECAALTRKRQALRQVDLETCVGCGMCIDELGCPAIIKQDGLPVITNTCTGCGVCSQICPTGAIREVR